MIDNYKKHRVGNLTVYHSNSLSDELTSMSLALRAGSVNDPEGKYGLAHFLEHMLFNGTEKYSKDYIDNELYQYGINNLNAFTSPDWIAVHGTSLTKYADRLFDVLFELVNNPRLSESDIEKERKIIIQEYYSSRDDIGGLLIQDFVKNLFYPNKYKDPAIGYKEDIESITIDDLRRYHKKFFNPYQQILIIRSNLSWSELESMLKHYYKPIVTQLKQFVPNQKFILKGTDITVSKQGFNQAGLIYAVPFNSKNSLKASILSNIYTGGLGSKLMKEVREKKGLTYSISSDVELFGNTGLFLIVTSFSESSRLQELKDTIKKVIYEPINEEELSRAINDSKVSIIKSSYSVYGYLNTVLYRLQSDTSTDFNSDISKIEKLNAKCLNKFKNSINIHNGNFYTIIQD